jgi:tetratricopeptide (TPR) repeat protein
MAKRKHKKPIPESRQAKKKVLPKRTTPLKKFWKGHLIPAAILAIVAIILYAQTYSYDYVLDDKIVIQDNQYTQKGISGIADIFKTESFQGYFGEQKDLLPGARYRPLSIASFALEVQLFGSSSMVGHIINMLLYMLTGLLLFRVLSLLFPNSKTTPWYFSIAFLAALFWVLQPVHSEVVANVKGRDEILALIGALAALYYCISYVHWKGVYKLILAPVIFFLGLMAKENAITFLAIIPVSMYFFSSAKKSDYLKVMAPLVLATVVYIFIRYQVIGYLLSSGKEFNDIMNNPFAGMNFEEKYATIFYTLLQYIKLSFIPHPLTHDYYPFHIPTMKWSSLPSLISLVLHTGLGLFAVWGLFKKNIYAYFAIFYLATLSIVSNVFVGVGTTMNERFIYMSTIASCLILAYVLNKKMYISKKNWMKYAALGIAGLIIVGYSYKAMTRIPVWQNALSLNTAAVKVSKNSARANCFMGTAIFENYHKETDRNKKQQLIEEADYYISRSIELYPNYLNGNVMKAGVAAERYKFHNDINVLLDGFKTVASRRPDTDYLHQYFEYLNGRGNYSSELINFYYDVGKNMLYDVKKNYSWSVKYLNYAYQLDPTNVAVNQALGNSYNAINNKAQAQKHFDLARTNQ